MKNLFLICLFCFVCLASKAQTLNRSAIYGELGGSGGYSSLSYEKQLFSKLPALSLRVGLGFGVIKQSFYLTAPIGLHYGFLRKNPKKVIETGISFTYGWVDSRISKEGQGSYLMMLVPSISYRQDFKDNLFWRVSFTPIFSLPNEFIPWTGFGIGKKF